MNRFTGGCAAAVLLLGVTGCNAGASEVSTNADRDQFVEDVRANAPEAEYYSDYQLLEVGQRACSDLQEGATIDELQELEWGENLTDATMERIRVTHAAAVTHLCPNEG